MFGDQIAAIREEADAAHVEFERAPARRFDLVIGADGLRSRVRELVFGPDDRFEKDLGYAIAASNSRLPPRDDDVYVVHNKPGAMVGRVTLRDDRTLFLLIFASEARKRRTTSPLRRLRCGRFIRTAGGSVRKSSTGSIPRRSSISIG